MLLRITDASGFHPCYNVSCGDILVGWEDPPYEATIIATGYGDVAVPWDDYEYGFEDIADGTLE